MMYVLRNLIFLLAALLLMAAPSYAAGLAIEKAWVRMPPPVAETAAVYMILTNTGETPIVVRSVSVNIAKTATFHSMTMHGGMMHMSEMEDVSILPGKQLVFEAGGNHVMLEGLTKILKAGDIVEIELETADGTIYSSEAKVRDMRKKNQAQTMHHQH